MKRSSGVRAAATVVVSAVTLALVTGCGGDSTGSDAKALSAAELKKAIIAQGDVEGYKVDASGKRLPSENEVKSTDDKCRPLAHAMGGLAPGDSPVSKAAVIATQEKKKPTDKPSKSLDEMSPDEIEDSLSNAMSLDMTIVGLSSYDGDGAEETFKSVSDAVKNCSGGFPFVMQGEDQKPSEVKPEKASGAGDESVAFVVKSDMDGDVGTSHVEVVRHGATIATYYTMNLGLMMTDKAYDVPAAIIDAQTAKLK
ncbi:hypothetical protein [Streptomyces sp. NPDC098781]|uniref:hypothetical protein n=1 Tax=Streptomyces sp. NPDC098781 TaxID=3366097 RepID=UPI003820BEAD